jgi:hypothetical protein
MKIEVTITKEVEVTQLQANCKVRYWEDAEVNGIEDSMGEIPCRQGEYWSPLIDLENGVIKNWEKGKTARIHYKVCDCGDYHLLTYDGEVAKSVDGYVPDIMCPEGEGYGDYVIMNVDENGKIDKWKAVLSEFIESED